MYLYHTMIKNLTAGYVIFHNCGSCKLNSTYLVLMEINGSIKKHACTHASVHVIATVKCFVQFCLWIYLLTQFSEKLESRCEIVFFHTSFNTVCMHVIYYGREVTLIK